MEKQNKNIAGYEHTSSSYEHTSSSYEQEYHKVKHSYLFTDPAYYKARSELAYLRYFKGIADIHRKKILEFGMGMGQNLFWLPADRRIGYDISDFAISFFKSKGGRATKDIDKIPDNMLDVVFSAHVLEHVENPLKTLRVIHSKLRKGGRLILITPIEKLKKKKDKNLKPDINQHLWTWTPQLMTNLLIQAGFEPIENKIIPTSGYKKLLPFRKLGIRVYDWVTRLSGRVTMDKELKFIAVKRSQRFAVKR